MKNFAAEIVGLDVKADLSALRRAFAKYSVLVARGVDATKEDLRRFAGLFGRPSGCDDITNIGRDGRILPQTSTDAIYAAGNELWHVDMPMLDKPPLGALLMARELPKIGGQTQFADLAAAFSALPWRRRQYLRTLIASHDQETKHVRMGLTDPALIKAAYPPKQCPLVCRDPHTNKLALFFGCHTSGFNGVAARQGERILAELFDHTTRLSNVYTHHWQLGDLLLWSNRRAMHRVLPYNSDSEPRRLWRVEILPN